jgi:hypothetical protein
LFQEMLKGKKGKQCSWEGMDCQATESDAASSA